MNDVLTYISMNDIITHITANLIPELVRVVMITNSISYLGGKVMLRNYNRTNGVIREFCTVDPWTVEERKKAVPEEKIRELKDYIEKLLNYTGEENLKTVYRNLKTVKIKRKPLLFIRGVSGNFNPEQNCIKYHLKSAIGHEFLHLASSYYNPKEEEEQNGFCQKKNLSIIGIRIHRIISI